MAGATANSDGGNGNTYSLATRHWDKFQIVFEGCRPARDGGASKLAF